MKVLLFALAGIFGVATVVEDSDARSSPLVVKELSEIDSNSSPESLKSQLPSSERLSSVSLHSPAGDSFDLVNNESFRSSGSDFGSVNYDAASDDAVHTLSGNEDVPTGPKVPRMVDTTLSDKNRARAVYRQSFQDLTMNEDRKPAAKKNDTVDGFLPSAQSSDSSLTLSDSDIPKKKGLLGSARKKIKKSVGSLKKGIKNIIKTPSKTTAVPNATSF